MTSKCLFIVVCLFVSLNTIHAQLKLVNGTIKITIGTTSGCRDTTNFILNQLAEAYRRYKDFLEVEFVPWGRTKRNADDSLTCQFGAKDCWANRVNRCVLDMLDCDQDTQVEYMICEYTTPQPAYLWRSYACARAAELRLVDLDYCVSTSGRALDDAAEEAAREPMSIINFVPSIHFNDVIDMNLHNQARKRLSSLICFALAEDPSTGVSNCQI